MITERTLRKWRKEALEFKSVYKPRSTHLEDVTTSTLEELTNRILQMTQELLDQHLLRRK